MIDEELRAAMRASREAALALTRDRRDGVADPVSFEQRFAAAVGADRAQELLERIAALWSEARDVPDPPGSIVTGYGRLLEIWAATHPEVDPDELRRITDELLFEHR